MDEETVFQASLLQQEAEKLQTHLEEIKRQLSELEKLSDHISHLNKTSEKEVISSLGKGVHIKTNLVEKKLFVEVGAGVIVRKTPEETIKVISSQLKRLKELKIHFSSQKDICDQTLSNLVAEMQQKPQNSFKGN